MHLVTKKIQSLYLCKTENVSRASKDRGSGLQCSVRSYFSLLSTLKEPENRYGSPQLLDIHIWISGPETPGIPTSTAPMYILIH